MSDQNNDLPAAALVSVQVGLPRPHGDEHASDSFDKHWVSGFYKTTVAGPIQVGWTNLAGDGQADLVNHGGIDKAVNVYPAAHYVDWRTQLKLAEFPHGAFGENLTISPWTEENVCIGDVWEIGEARFQVSQPRQPCWKLARRWRIRDLTAQVVENGRTGWYLRVLQEGAIAAGQPIRLTERMHPAWTIRRANDIMHHAREDPGQIRQLAQLPELSASWRRTLAGRLTS